VNMGNVVWLPPLRFGLLAFLLVMGGSLDRKCEVEAIIGGVNIPSFEFPQINLPTINFPQINIPDISIPDINIPDLISPILSAKVNMINGLASAIPFAAPAAETRVGKETRNNKPSAQLETRAKAQLETPAKSSQASELSSLKAARKGAKERNSDPKDTAILPHTKDIAKREATSTDIAMPSAKFDDGTKKRRRVRIRIAKDGTREVVSMKEGFVGNNLREVKRMRRSQAMKGRKLLLT